MEKILKTGNYTLIYSEPDIIAYGTIDGRLTVYMDEAEEFTRNFFSTNSLSKHQRNKDFLNAKGWLIAILSPNKLYDEMKDLTGYKSHTPFSSSVKKFGLIRSRKEAINQGFLQKYGMSIAQYKRKAMKNKWKNDKGGRFRDRISRTASEGMRAYWKDKRLEKMTNEQPLIPEF